MERKKKSIMEVNSELESIGRKLKELIMHSEQELLDASNIDRLNDIRLDLEVFIFFERSQEG